MSLRCGGPTSSAVMNGRRAMIHHPARRPGGAAPAVGGGVADDRHRAQVEAGGGRLQVMPWESLMTSRSAESSSR